MQALANIEYIKDLNRSYMVIPEGEVKGEENYCIRMLQAERPEGLLKPETRRINNRLLYYYDITSRQSLAVIAAREVLDYNNVKKLVSGIIDIIETAYEYLLDEDDFVLLPDQIFMDIKEHSPYLCYYPGYGRDIREQMGSLLEFIMNKIDYKDKPAVLLVYELYAAARAEGFTIEHLKEKLKPDISSDEKDISLQKSTGASPAAPSARADAKKISAFNEKRAGKETIPAVMERITREREVLKYPPATYLYTALVAISAIFIAIFLFKSGLMSSPAGNRLDYSKVAAMLLVLLCVSAYLMRRLWDKKNRIAKIVTDSEYVDPTAAGDEPDHRIRDYYPAAGVRESGTKVSDTKETGTKETNAKEIGTKEMGTNEDTENGEYNPTCLLNACVSEGKYMLKPCDETRYRTILIEEFPFFIGKLKKNMDYCLDKEVVSRCHAKLTKEHEHIYITDLNSTNGTFVNNELLQPYKRREIKAGDEIAFADIGYRFIM